MGRVAGRVALLALSIVAAAWLIWDLRALTLDAHARADARTAQSRAQVAHALSLYSQASRGNADPTPRIDEARFLLALGRTRAASEILSRVVSANPGNLIAWSLLAKSSATTDPPRAAEAAEQLHVLFGHPKGYRIQQASITTPSGVVTVAPQLEVGLVESAGVIGDVAKFEGWALSAQKILITANGRLVATGVPTGDRPDVARSYHSKNTRLGFTIPVPVSVLESGGRKAAVRAFGSNNRIASQLPVNCRPPQPFGC
jgi:hypothetical protein